MPEGSNSAHGENHTGSILKMSMSRHFREALMRNLMAESRQAIPRMMAVATWHNITLDYTDFGVGPCRRQAWREDEGRTVFHDSREQLEDKR